MSAIATDARSAVTVRGLRKAFGGEPVLDGIDLEIAEGTIFALLGPNGAGKTTVVRILSTLIPSDSGDLRVAGHDVVGDSDGVRAAIGVRDSSRRWTTCRRGSNPNRTCGARRGRGWGWLSLAGVSVSFAQCFGLGDGEPRYLLCACC